jgi:phosphopantetheinyl transferase
MCWWSNLKVFSSLSLEAEYCDCSFSIPSKDGVDDRDKVSDKHFFFHVWVLKQSFM